MNFTLAVTLLVYMTILVNGKVDMISHMDGPLILTISRICVDEKCPTLIPKNILHIEVSLTLKKSSDELLYGNVQIRVIDALGEKVL